MNNKDLFDLIWNKAVWFFSHQIWLSHLYTAHQSQTKTIRHNDNLSPTMHLYIHKKIKLNIHFRHADWIIKKTACHYTWCEPCIHLSLTLIVLSLSIHLSLTLLVLALFLSLSSWTDPKPECLCIGAKVCFKLHYPIDRRSSLRVANGSPTRWAGDRLWQCHKWIASCHWCPICFHHSNLAKDDDKQKVLKKATNKQRNQNQNNKKIA